MGVRKDDLTQYIQQLETLKADIPAIMSKIAAGEGAYAVKQARLICKNDNVINTGSTISGPRDPGHGPYRT